VETVPFDLLQPWDLMHRRWMVPLFLYAGACAGSHPAQAPTPTAGTTAAITPADLRVREYIFADDSMQGRRAGTLGNQRGNAYIAVELRRLGLRPAGDQGTYLQRVPLISYAIDPARATLRAGSERLTPFQDYYPYQAAFDLPSRSIRGAPLVYIGSKSDSANLPPREAPLRGKVVVFRSPSTGPSLGAPDLSPDGQLDRLVVDEARAVPPGITQPRMLFLPTATVSRLFGKPLDALKPGDTGAALEDDVSFERTDLGATNVVAILEGGDPTLRGSFVALGAHNDAIGIVAPVDHDSLRAYNSVMRRRGANDPKGTPSAEQWRQVRGLLDSLRRMRPARPDSIVNGADDDGSGSMALLEIAEKMAAGPRPKRSVIFVWHTGEESGLQGSRWFTDHPTVPRDSIVSQINIDMIARGWPADEAKGGPGYLQVIGSRRLSTELGDLVEAVNREGKLGLDFDYSYDAEGHPDNFYCRSDHYNYAGYGIPIAFFSTGGHRDYHQVTDEPEYLDYPKFARVTSFVADVTERLANLDHRPRLDKPKPDPEAPCHQ
jgi:hypothetical protein